MGQTIYYFTYFIGNTQYELIQENKIFYWVVKNKKLYSDNKTFITNSKQIIPVTVQIKEDIFDTKNNILYNPNHIKQNFLKKSEELMNKDNVLVIYRNCNYKFDIPYPEGKELPYLFTYIDKIDNYTHYEIDFGNNIMKNIVVRE